MPYATRKEINNFADLFAPNSVLLGPDASETRLERINRDLSRFGFVHLATYAVPDRIRGERSALVLSQADVPDPLESIANGCSPVDGRLTVEEIVRGWRLQAEVVTLTACEDVEDESSNGYLGFAYAFLQVGARSVVVNRWRVPDAPTHILMNRFYENLAERALDKKRALDDAKAWLRDYATESGERPYRHPGYWASFALVGDPYWANN